MISPHETMMDADYTDDLALLANTAAQAEFQLRSLEQGGIGLHVKTNEIGYICFKQKGDISILNGKPHKLVNQFTYIGSNVSSTENDVSIHLTKAWNSIYRQSIIWKFNLLNKTEFLPSSRSVHTTKCIHHMDAYKTPRKKLHIDSTRRLCAVLKISLKQHPTKRLLYDQTIQIRRSRHAWHCWRSKWRSLMDSYIWTCQCWPTSKDLPRLSADTESSLDDLPREIDR